MYNYFISYTYKLGEYQGYGNTMMSSHVRLNTAERMNSVEQQLLKAAEADGLKIVYINDMGADEE